MVRSAGGRLQSVSVYGSGKNITDASLVAIAANCPALEELALHSCPKVTDKGLSAVASGCSALRRIEAHGCKLVT